MTTYLEKIETTPCVWHADAGHAWLEVPMQYLKDLNILDKITDYDIKYDKSLKEVLEFMYSQDVRSNEVSRKSIVAIIGTAENGDVLELPLLTLASPYTIM